MASDTFTCSRCGQASYYRDGSYLFGQQIICARCYSAQAAPPPGMGIPAAVPAPPGMPQAPYAQVAAPPRANILGILGLACAFLGIACVAMAAVALRPLVPEFKEVIQYAQEHQGDQEGVQKKMQELMERHQDKMALIGVGGCGYLFLPLGMLLSLIGIFLRNVRKGAAIAGLVLNGLLFLGPCLFSCMGGAMR